MISIQELETHFGLIRRDWLDVMIEIHSLVARFAPDATAEIRRYGVVYYHGNCGGPVSAGICQSLIKPDHFRLAFNHGAFLPDPARLLEGETFPKRFMRITAYDGAPWEEIATLIEASAGYDPRKSLPN